MAPCVQHTRECFNIYLFSPTIINTCFDLVNNSVILKLIDVLKNSNIMDDVTRFSTPKIKLVHLYFINQLLPRFLCSIVLFHNSKLS